MGRWQIGLAVLLMSGCGGGAAATSAGAHGGATAGDARISRSGGQEGGIVVLYPRVMGSAGDEPARLQAHMVELARRVFPERPLDVRPEPERVCPHAGCQGASLGALILVRDGTCVAAGIVGPPGPSELTITRWAGELTVRDRVIPFRDPPESHLAVHDMIPCDALDEALAQEDYAVEEALRRALGH